MTQGAPADPNRGIPDLVGQLASDAKQLVRSEVRLARLETTESFSRAGRGALWLGVALGVAVVMIVAFTLFLATLIGRVANGHHWIGALVTAVLELALGAWLVRRGLQEFAKAPYSLPETRGSLRNG